MISKWLQNETLEMFPPYKRFPSGVNAFFIHITKTAGTSVRRCLELPRPRNSNGLFKKHYTHHEIQELVDPILWNNSFKFSFVRNPWDRVYSYYHYRKRKFFSAHPELNSSSSHLYPSFEDWVDNYIIKSNTTQSNFAPQYTWIYDKEGNLQVDFLGRFENLHSDFEIIKKTIGMPKIQLGHFNKTERPKDYRLGYNKRTKEAVANYFKKDIELFNYTY